MSQPLLTLRPPANQDWVVGYPGIPPSAQDDRSHAEVRGTVELRPSRQMKAKWLRIELRKVETLPANHGIFFDFVGQSPLTLWQSEFEDGSVLQACDYPFNIRIPESIPPTLNLDKIAGIRYELVASVCTKAKKSLFSVRKDPNAVHSISANIVIDKHELHATWPIYSQPDSRQTKSGALELIVNRTSTCYAPGDRVAVIATVKSDDLGACVLRTIEFILRENVVFRAGPHGPSKKNVPQIRTLSVGEQRSNANVTLYGGTQFRTELACSVPLEHVTATVNTARHIDVSYFMYVRAVFDNNKVLEVNMPVTLSNWPRSISSEAVKRIGPAPNLSLHAALVQPDPISPTTSSSHGASQPAPSVDQMGRLSQRAISQTVPARSGHSPSQSLDLTSPTRIRHMVSPSLTNIAEQASEVPTTVNRSPPASTVSQARTTGTSTVTSPRLQALDLLAGEDTPAPAAPAPSIVRTATTPAPAPASGPIRAWPTAEQEKQRLYDDARARAEQTQNRLTSGAGGSSAAEQPRTTVGSGATPWLAAEAEKSRLYHEAQEGVARAQVNGVRRPSSSNSNSDTHSRQSSVSGKRAAAEALYKQAVSTMNASATPTASPRPKSPPARQPTAPPAAANGPKTPTKSQFPTAEEEKAAMAFHEAKMAAERFQSALTSPVGSGSRVTASPPARDAQLPARSQYPTAAEEKAEMAYREARQAAERFQASLTSPDGARSQNGHGQSSSTPQYQSAADENAAMIYREASEAVERNRASSYAGGSGGFSRQSSAHATTPNRPASRPSMQELDSAAAEKERVRQAFAARDAAALAAMSRTRRPSASASSGNPAQRQSSFVIRNATPPSSPPTATRELQPTAPPPRSPSVPPSAFDSTMSEKERIRRAFEARDAAAQGLPAPYSPAYPEASHANGNGNGYMPVEAPQWSPRQQTVQPRRPNTGGSVDEPRDPAIKRGKMREIDAPPPLAPKPPADYVAETIRRDTKNQEYFAGLKLDFEPGLDSVPDTPPQHPIDGFNAPPLPPKLPV